MVLAARKRFEEEVTALGGRLQQAQQEAAGWRAAHATTERHLVAAQDAVTERREAEAAARAMSAEEMSRITEQIEHRARITKGRQQRHAAASIHRAGQEAHRLEGESRLSVRLPGHYRAKYGTPAGYADRSSSPPLPRRESPRAAALSP